MYYYFKRVILFSLMMLSFTFAEDLIIDGETVYMAGEQTFGNVIIINSGVLAVVEYGGSNQTQGAI